MPPASAAILHKHLCGQRGDSADPPSWTCDWPWALSRACWVGPLPLGCSGPGSLSKAAMVPHLALPPPSPPGGRLAEPPMLAHSTVPGPAQRRAAQATRAPRSSVPLDSSHRLSVRPSSVAVLPPLLVWPGPPIGGKPACCEQARDRGQSGARRQAGGLSAAPGWLKLETVAKTTSRCLHRRAVGSFGKARVPNRMPPAPRGRSAWCRRGCRQIRAGGLIKIFASRVRSPEHPGTPHSWGRKKKKSRSWRKTKTKSIRKISYLEIASPSPNLALRTRAC
mmetsp:Transcript_124965/g.400335  ORF Transcript_124965/g.400335 Transcript_124965/m.400335 type:complete len:279 (+) Transcript_124965:1-837(+)